MIVLYQIQLGQALVVFPTYFELHLPTKLILILIQFYFIDLLCMQNWLLVLRINPSISDFFSLPLAP